MFKLIIIMVIIANIAADHALKSKPPSNDRIINGETVSIKHVPYQISLHEHGQHICGGSIISREWVITAGHCVERHKILLYSIRAGSTEHSWGGSLHEIDEIVRHEKYGSIHNHPVNDIALLHVWNPFYFDDTRQPIRLFHSGERIPHNIFAVISGWGQTRFGIPNLLQMARVPIIRNQDCNRKYAKEGGINEKQICAAYDVGGIDACYGDSGGPLVVGDRLAGIVSWAIDCASAKYPGVYTEIAAYRPWIHNVITDPHWIHSIYL